jgi:hypothetical protein
MPNLQNLLQPPRPPGLIDVGGALYVFKITPSVRELAPSVTVDEIQAATEPPLQIPVPPSAMDV